MRTLRWLRRWGLNLAAAIAVLALFAGFVALMVWHDNAGPIVWRVLWIGVAGFVAVGALVEWVIPNPPASHRR